MPINFPGFNASPVPEMRPVNPVQPPPFVDPAGIIMQAAALRQQRALAEKQMAQKGIEDINSAIQSAQSLAERKREAESSERIANMTAQIASGKVKPEEALMAAQTEAAQAHAEYLKSQAKLYEGTSGMSNDAATLIQATQPGPNGEPPRMTFEQAAEAAKGRGPAMQIHFLRAAADAANSGANFMTGTVQQAGQKALAAAQAGTSVQIPQATAKTLGDLTSSLLSKAQKAGLGENQLANRLKIMAESGNIPLTKQDPDMADYVATHQEIQRQLAQLFSLNGVPQEMVQRAANETLPIGMGLSAMKRLAGTSMPGFIQARISALRGVGPSLPGASANSAQPPAGGGWSYVGPSQ